MCVVLGSWRVLLWTDANARACLIRGDVQIEPSDPHVIDSARTFGKFVNKLDLVVPALTSALPPQPTWVSTYWHTIDFIMFSAALQGLVTTYAVSEALVDMPC